MSENLNLFLNRFYMFKINLFVHGARRRLDQRSNLDPSALLRMAAREEELWGTLEHRHLCQL